MSVRTDRHFLDWANKPVLYKGYTAIPPAPLPRDFDSPGENALRAVAGYLAEGGRLDLRQLAGHLFFSAGITKQLRFGDEVFEFRAASCAGALYPIEVYVVAGDVDGIEPGVYHFHPKEFALRRLRGGDFRHYLYEATRDPRVKSVQAVLAFTAIFWRSAWKYRARSYRYCHWDCGTILANLLATAFASKLSVRIVSGFHDEGVNRLLGINGLDESTLCLVTAGEGSPSKGSPTVEGVTFDTQPITSRKVDYPLIKSIHVASMLDGDEVAGWRREWPARRATVEEGLVPIRPRDPATVSSPLGRTIIRRGSTRRFARESIPFEALSTILANSTKGIPCDFLGNESSLIDIYTIVNAVDGLAAGAYYFSREGKGLLPLKSGNFRSEAGYLCLEQQLGEDAAAVNFLMSDLEAVLQAYGNRGYRLAHLEAGIRGGKMYLAAFAQGIGATGLTFYDNDVTSFFSPHAEGKSCVLVIALGIKQKGWRRMR